LTKVSEDIWVFDGAPISAAGLPIPLRMTVLRLSSGDLLLHSPVQYSQAIRSELEGLGRIKYLLAPNIAHWMFLADWQTKLPDALTFVAPGLASRSQVRRAGIRIDRELGGGTPSEWADDIETVLVSAPFFGEVELFDKRSRTLILTDLVQNLDPKIFPSAFRPVAHLLGVSKPDEGHRSTCGYCCILAADRCDRRLGGWSVSLPKRSFSRMAIGSILMERSVCGTPSAGLFPRRVQNVWRGQKK
jgi:hypothetical protein